MWFNVIWPHHKNCFKAPRELRRGKARGVYTVYIYICIHFMLWRIAFSEMLCKTCIKPGWFSVKLLLFLLWTFISFNDWHAGIPTFKECALINKNYLQLHFLSFHIVYDSVFLLFFSRRHTLSKILHNRNILWLGIERKYGNIIWV